MIFTKYFMLSIKRQIVCVFLSIFLLSGINANNLSISNVSYDNALAEVSFTLTWENSWRRDASPPYNYDGVWLFVKVRECHAKNTMVPGQYYHAWLDTDSTNHSATQSGTDSLSIEVGTTDIGGNDRGMGIFVYRYEDGGAGDLTTNVTLKWDKATQAGAMTEIDAAANYDVKVFGIEMVKIPQGAFYLGDDNTSTYSFLEQGTTNDLQILSENDLSVSGTLKRELDTTDVTGDALGADYPKGYDAFWIMKYELSQGMYAEFLNTLTKDQIYNRVAVNMKTINQKYYALTSNGNVVARSAVAFVPTGDVRTQEFGVDYDDDDNMNESSDGAGIACNYLSIRDVLAFLDWAALRPITEFEYEKACRGPNNSLAGEYAWGSSEITAITSVLNAGSANEVASNSGNGLSNYNVSNSGGPMRCGFAATAASSRKLSGASYYGVLELSGNLFEPCIGAYDDNSFPMPFTGGTGDGEIDSEGYHDVTDWPAHTGDADHYKFIARGASYARGDARMRVSDRGRSDQYRTNCDGRDSEFGCRGGR